MKFNMVRTMGNESPEVVVAGHICIDIIPEFGATVVPLEMLLRPGHLTRVGPALLSTGGAVSNTGLALHRLGTPVQLMGKIGRDLFGEAILGVLRRYDPALADGMLVGDDPSSYTLVISPPGIDRIFIHCPGANDTFGAADIPLDQVARARIFHFGYPPIMQRMYLDEGRELAALMAAVQEKGVVTSLDMAQPDPASEAGQVDWRAILHRTLPFVDIIAPSLDETLFMLDRARFEEMHSQNGLKPDGEILHWTSDQLLEMGAAIVALKLGGHGLYLRTSADPARLGRLRGLLPVDLTGWLNRELYTTCFHIKEAGTTGAGDCTIAGLLAGLLRGQSIEGVLTSAVAVGACSVERADATSGVIHWDEVQTRLRTGWMHRVISVDLAGWRGGPNDRVWFGPTDGQGMA